MYLFYTLRDEASGRVDAIYQDHEVSEAEKVKGFHYEGELPEPIEGEGEAVLYVNPATGHLWYEGEVSSSGNDIAELTRRLREAENRLKNPDERYKGMSLEGASLEQLKEAKVAQLKYLSEKEMAAGFKSPSLGYTFGFEEIDQKNISNQVVTFIADPNKTGCTWKTLDVGVVELTKAEFLGIVPEAEAHTRAKIGRQWQLSQDVLAAPTKAAVHAINW